MVDNMQKIGENTSINKLMEKTMERYIIRNCENVLVGNPKGYRTFRGANTQANGPLNRTLWAMYATQKNAKNNLVFSIKLEKF